MERTSGMTSEPSEPPRVTAGRLEEPLTLHVLVSRPVTLALADLLAGLQALYPSAGMGACRIVGDRIDTALGGVSVLWSRDPQDRRPCATTLTATADGPDPGWSQIIHRSRFVFAHEAARAAIDAHQGRLTITLGAIGDTPAARIDAARRLTCIGAVLARDPACLALHYPAADLILPPDMWIRAAEVAVAGGFPVVQWVNILHETLPDGRDPAPVTASSLGLAPFFGCELAVVMARLAPEAAVRLAYDACLSLAEDGVLPKEGASMESVKLRLRLLRAGQHGVQTDVWALLHPTCALDEAEVFGPLPQEAPDLPDPAPADGWLRRGLARLGAGRGHPPRLAGTP